uniref:Uncharacterized protein n=1 Tax=Fagus sylvatica TaxID=28930 RepID=A0A2N9J113_FAGSY
MGQNEREENGFDPEDDHNLKREEEEVGDELSVERIFEKQQVPSWRKQLTVRAFVVSLVLSILFSFIVMKLNLTTGIIPSLNVSAGLLSFFFVKTWTKFLSKSGLLRLPFTRQENTVIQTCVVASSGIAFSGGFGRPLCNDERRQTINRLLISRNSWDVMFLFVVSFLGLFSVVPLRKIMVIDFKLTYPSGTATAHLINSFHTPQGAKLAKKQVRELGKFFSLSFLWGFFQWFYTAGDNCGFASFPSLGLKAYEYKTWPRQFQWSSRLQEEEDVVLGLKDSNPDGIDVVGLGFEDVGFNGQWIWVSEFGFGLTMVVFWFGGHDGLSLDLWFWYGIEVISGTQRMGFGVGFPALGMGCAGLLVMKVFGVWSVGCVVGDSRIVFIAIAMILGDGLYNFLKVLSRTLFGLYHQLWNKDVSSDLPVADHSSQVSSQVSYDDKRRTQLFLKDKIPSWFAIGGYVAIAAVSVATLPHIFHELKWYYILVMYIFAPALAFCNAYGSWAY